MKNLILEYHKKKKEVKNRLKYFKKINNSKNEDIFAELCFCLLTPQSKAVHCDRAIRDLKKTGLLFNGRENDIKARLKGLARFHNKKAAYLVAARKFFRSGKKIDIKNRLKSNDVFEIREWLVKNIKGLGHKEASHFLRNIGLGKDIAIIDRHILRNLKKYNLIKKIPKSITRKKYIEIENKMRRFAKRIDISLGELDLLFWSSETGFVFK